MEAHESDHGDDEEQEAQEHAFARLTAVHAHSLVDSQVVVLLAVVAVDTVKV